nr:MAG TPA_asm: hypothetical protein [Caudoviricetes sp.]
MIEYLGSLSIALSKFVTNFLCASLSISLFRKA